MRVEIPATATAMDIFRGIERWVKSSVDFASKEFEEARNEQTKLWWYLTIFRGPDNGDEYVKCATTAFIRKKLLPRLASCCGAIVSQEEVNETTIAKKLAEIDLYSDPIYLGKHKNPVQNHFARHYKLALNSLRNDMKKEAEEKV